MTKEEAINCLKSFKTFDEEDICSKCKYKDNCNPDEAIDMAIGALQKPCEDATNRKIDEWEIEGKPAELWLINGMLQIRILGTIHNVLLPPVTPTQRTCHSCNQDYADCDQFVCSECGIELQDWNRVDRDEDDGDITYHEYVFRYCPNCGSKILEETE